MTDCQCLVYYPGWVQPGVPPEAVDLTAWTHVSSFGFYPTADGCVAAADISGAQAGAQVAAVHAAGRKAVCTIGGEGQGAAFAAATQRHLARFVDAIASVRSRWGYDGIDVDWEESFDPSGCARLVSALRAALPPSVTLSLDVDTGQHPAPGVAALAGDLDWVSIMCYWDSGAAQVSTYLTAGVPRGKLLLGVGLSPGFHDRTQADVAAKVDYARANALRGVMCWHMGNLDTAVTDARLVPLRTAVRG